MAWSEYDKERFFDAVKNAVAAGATPESLVKELEADYYIACDEMKSSAKYSFEQMRKGH